MKYKTYLTACAVMDKVNEIDKAIEYMETVPVSTECHDAIIDMLKYDKEGLIEDFKKLCDIEDPSYNTEEDYNDTKVLPKKYDDRDDLTVHC